MKKTWVHGTAALLLGAAAIGAALRPSARPISPPAPHPARATIAVGPAPRETPLGSPPAAVWAPTDVRPLMDEALATTLRLRAEQEKVLRAAFAECLDGMRSVKADRRLTPEHREMEIERLRMELEPRIRTVLDADQQALLAKARAERRQAERERRIGREVRRTAVFFELDPEQGAAFEARVRAHYDARRVDLPPRAGLEDGDRSTLLLSTPGLSTAQRDQIRSELNPADDDE